MKSDIKGNKRTRDNNPVDGYTKDRPLTDLMRSKFSRLFAIFTPFIVLVSFLPAILPLGSLGYALMANSALRIIALSILLAVSIIARTQYSKAEFKKLATNFLFFAFLFLVAEFLWYTIHLYAPTSRVLFFIPHVFWLLGYVPLLYACWTTLFEYSEYARERDVFLMSFLMFGMAIIILVPISIAIVNSQNFYLPGEKVLAILYPFIDCVVLFSLLFLLHIYRKGKLAFYWSAVTAGILLYSIGDIGTNSVIAGGFDFLTPVTYGFFIMAYSFLALSLGLVAYFQWKISLLEPEGRYSVDQVFLIYKSGVLIAHRGRETEIMDTDIVSGMLTAVQDFIKDSFDRTKTSTEKLRRLQYGGLEIEIEHGSYIFLAVVVNGVGTEHLHARMKETITRIEQDYTYELANWKGNRDDITDIDNYLGSLF